MEQGKESVAHPKWLRGCETQRTSKLKPPRNSVSIFFLTTEQVGSFHFRESKYRFIIKKIIQIFPPLSV